MTIVFLLSIIDRADDDDDESGSGSRSGSDELLLLLLLLLCRWDIILRRLELMCVVVYKRLARQGVCSTTEVHYEMCRNSVLHQLY